MARGFRWGAAAVLAGAVAAMACGGVAPPEDGPGGLVPGGDVSITPGSSAPYSIYTHCGIRSAQINGQLFYAQPPLGDGSGNPPPGWGNPFDQGTLTLHSDGTADFRDQAGHQVRFTSHPTPPPPSLPVCA